MLWLHFRNENGGHGAPLIEKKMHHEIYYVLEGATITQEVTNTEFEFMNEDVS